MKAIFTGTSAYTIQGLSKASFSGPDVMRMNPLYQINDDLFKPIAAMYSQFETYSLRVEKMFDALMALGGPDLVIDMINMGQGLSPDLGVQKGGGYRYGLVNSFKVHDGKNSLSMTAVHFTDWAFQMAMDTGEEGKLDFEHAEFDEFIQSLRDAVPFY